MSRKRITYRRRISKKELENQIIYTEQVLQQEIISRPKIEETIEEKGMTIDSDVSVPSIERKESLIRRFFKWAKF